MNGISLKEIKFKNYIVAHPQKWEDTDVLKITLEEIRSGINFNLPIKTPHNQHNVIRIDDYKQKLLDFIEKRKLV